MTNRDQLWLMEEQFTKDRAASADRHAGLERVDDKRVIIGIVHVLKSGGRWIDAPPEYGPKKTLYNRYVRWAVRERRFRSFSSKDGRLRRRSI